MATATLVPSAAKDLAEDVISATPTKAEFPEDAVQVSTTENVFLREVLVERRIAVLIVLLLFLRVREDCVGLSNFLEAFFRLLVIGIFVRMIFHRQLAISFLYLVSISSFFQAEGGIVIFGHSFSL